MESTPDPGRRKLQWSDWAIAVFLFGATAAVIIWQNSRLTVLWDLSYILENSQRIAAGDIPYKDFPFPYAPLTFLIQAGIIRLFGRVIWHHVVYCSVMGGLATVVTWRILLNLLHELGGAGRWVSFVLSLPLIVLGIYCVYPHPFYDCDCTPAILMSILLWQCAEWKGFPLLLSFLVGFTFAIPLFIKQNTGGAFLAGLLFMLLVLIALEWWSGRPVRRFLVMVGGAITGVIVALTLIHFTAGLGNYWHWTVQFAAARRTPARTEMLEIYRDNSLLLFLFAFVLGGLLLLFKKRRNRWLSLLAGLIVAAPFTWPVIYLLRDPDSSERAERLIGVWPFVLVLALVVGVIQLFRNTNAGRTVPLVIIATVQGAFLSQQLWGSTYAIWPLWIILVAGIVATLGKAAGQWSGWTTIPLAGVITVSLLISGAFYVWSHERLDYANLTDGDLARSNLASLKGLSMRGQWITNFEQLVAYAEREIPPDDGILMLPGEDLFYYATGRRPHFPVLMFDHTVNPYSADEILNLARQRNIRWLVVKQELQLEEDLVDSDKDRIAEVLKQDFKQVESLDNYDIYRRREPNEKDDEDDDDEPDDSR